MARLRFVNLDGSGPQPISAVLKWALWDRVSGKRSPSRWVGTTPSVTPDAAVIMRPPARGEGARLTWLGHASWLVQLDGVSLLIDPVFSNSIGPGTQRYVAPALEPGTLPRIDAQLVTHNHRDHLDMPSVLRVGSPVLAGTGMGPTFAREKLACTELAWWASTRVGDVSVHFVPSQHWSQRGLNDINATLWGGFIVEGSSARVYHSGDTAYFGGFSEIGRRHGPLDAALLPIGAYSPAWFMSRQHMNPEEAVQAFVDLGARRFVAMHHATFQLTDEPREEPEARLHTEWQRRNLDPSTYDVPPVGGTLSVRSAP
jgi:L-ascorbate metabolism protein UlaG (beta-lactamase superfamily)